MRWAAVSRRGRWLAVAAGVVAVHLLLVSWLETTLADWGADAFPPPPRTDVAFVRTLEPAEPPTVAPAPAQPPPPTPRPRRAAAAPALPAASAPAPATTPEPVPPTQLAVTVATPEPAASAVMPVPPDPSPPATSDAAANVDAVVPANTAASAPPFEWPPSTRLSYKLAGNYRGEIQGRARVQWVRQGPRYQVQFDVTVGPPFAPLMSRSMTSDGELSAGGLVPHRYDESTKVAFQAPRRLVMMFTPESVLLANGSIRPALAGVQDTASQFVQMTWLFTTQPQRLRVGQSVEFPLALPRRMDRWTYDVAQQETLYTTVGALETFHLKPRRAEERPRGELSAELWIAPSMQYLPVRIRIQQDRETYIDLQLDAAPLQAAPEAPLR